MSVACTAYYFCLLLTPKIKKEGAVNVKLGLFFANINWFIFGDVCRDFVCST